MADPSRDVLNLAPEQHSDRDLISFSAIWKQFTLKIQYEAEIILQVYRNALLKRLFLGASKIWHPCGVQLLTGSWLVCHGRTLFDRTTGEAKNRVFDFIKYLIYNLS
jgi:hypothetical protein